MESATIITAFLTRIVPDKRIEFSHIGLFLAIYQLWQGLEFDQPIKITRRKLMSLSKIRSTATYHKCIRELVELDFIRYVPSYNPIGRSVIYWKTILDDEFNLNNAV